MKKSISLILLLCFSYFLSYSQFILEVNSSKLNSCKDTSVEFTAHVTNGGLPVSDVNYTWSFGDGSSIQSGLNLDTVKHTFSKGGGYIIRVDANKGIENDYFLYKFEVALTPDFKGTISDRKDPICLGQKVFLTGKVTDSTWTYQIPSLNKEQNPAMILNSGPYQSVLDYRIFNKSQNLVLEDDIDSVGINLENNNLSTLKIELICPNGTGIILKDFGGSNKYFGEPIIGGNSELPGVGYTYYWTNSPAFGTMNSIVPAGNYLPAGTYTPEQSFSLLSGCPLNGEWKIKVTDNLVPDTGFVFFSQIIFNPSVLPAAWEYKHTYSSLTWFGSGVSFTSKGLATAIPIVHGNHRYTFKVKDNFNCPQSTELYTKVEEVTFTIDPAEGGPFPLPVKFDNTTSWATDYIWDFGDNSDFGTDDTTTHIYTKDGHFWAKLTAITNDNCKDTAGMLVIITIPVSSFDDLYNVFTPDGDAKGLNEVFTISETSLEGIETLNCKIYSRWGKKVAEWNSVEDAKTGWDGNYNGGQQASPGVYYYVIVAVGYDGKEYFKKGFFQLFR